MLVSFNGTLILPILDLKSPQQDTVHIHLLWISCSVVWSVSFESVRRPDEMTREHRSYGFTLPNNVFRKQIVDSKATNYHYCNLLVSRKDTCMTDGLRCVDNPEHIADVDVFEVASPFLKART